jgi:uncharacterized membrane protein (DUF106 family)
MVLNSLLDPILSPLLLLYPVVAIGIMALVITIIINIITKLVTDQTLMKDLKDEMKALQKQMKELKDNPKKMMEVNKKFTEVNMKYMGKSMKSTLYTFIPIIIIFGWMSGHLAYEPIHPGEEFTVALEFAEGYTGPVNMSSLPELEYVSSRVQEVNAAQAVFVVKAPDPGEYRMTFSYGDFSSEHDVLISNEVEYLSPVMRQKDKYNPLKQIVVGNEKVKPLGDFSLFGWEPGWLATYIFFSLVFSLVLRRVMKIY